MIRAGFKKAGTWFTRLRFFAMRNKKMVFSTTQRKEMLKGKSKNELIRMVLQNELVIAQMMKEFKVTSLDKYVLHMGGMKHGN